MTSESSDTTDSASATLQNLKAQIAGCQLCQLSNTRTNTVPGEGSALAEVMFIGEGPGRDEDLSGRPFVGRAGKLLDELIASIPMRRDDVFIANIIKCRPPDNRDPEPAEINACTPYLKRQIDTIDPLVIVTLGRFALNYFFPDMRITRSHGQILQLNNRALLPLYHPSSGLRNPQHATALRQDIHKIPEAIAEAIRIRNEATQHTPRITNQTADTETTASTDRDQQQNTLDQNDDSQKSFF